MYSAYAIASLVVKTHLKEDYIIPKVNDPRILPIVTEILKNQSKVRSKTYRNQQKLDK